MRKVSQEEIYQTPNYYLPHHAVIKPDRLTTKLRVIFNASSPTLNKYTDRLYWIEVRHDFKEFNLEDLLLTLPRIMNF